MPFYYYLMLRNIGIGGPAARGDVILGLVLSIAGAISATAGAGLWITFVHRLTERKINLGHATWIVPVLLSCMLVGFIGFACYFIQVLISGYHL